MALSFKSLEHYRQLLICLLCLGIRNPLQTDPAMNTTFLKLFYEPSLKIKKQVRNYNNHGFVFIMVVLKIELFVFNIVYIYKNSEHVSWTLPTSLFMFQALGPSCTKGIKHKS